MANFQVKVQTPLERSTIIGDATNVSREPYIFYEFQNKRNNLPVVRLSIGLPIYRISNYRTYTAQLAHIRERNLPEDFFSAGQENESVQSAQHNILLEFAKKGRDGSIVPILNQLKEEEQREPLLITSDGLVVNGNRRLAAMRELFLDDSVQFTHFSHVDCAVLPENITLEEIREVEVRLQMRAETRLPYGWIEESIAIREMLESGKTSNYVAGLMKKRSKEVTTAAKALTETDIFLKEWRREPGRYELVEDKQQIFHDLAKAIDGIEGETAEVKRRIAWTLISTDPTSLDGRLYGYNFSFENKTDEVIAVLCDRLSINLTPPPNNDVPDDTGEDIDIQLEDDNDMGFPLENLIEAFDDPDPNRHATITKELIEACNSIRERERENNTGNQALKQICGAHSKLISADISKANPNTYDSIRAQLEALKKRVEVLENTLSQYTSASS